MADLECAEIQDLFSASSVIIYDRERGRELAVEIRTIPYRLGMTSEVREVRWIEQGLGFPTAPVGSTWSAFSAEHNYCPHLIDVLGDVLRGTVELYVDGRLLKIYDNGFAFSGTVMEWPPWGVDSIPQRQDGDTDA